MSTAGSKRTDRYGPGCASGGRGLWRDGMRPDGPAPSKAVKEQTKPERPAVADAERNAMITDNLGLAHQLARRFLHRGEPLEDLVQVASVALVKSVDRFDPGRGVDFAA